MKNQSKSTFSNVFVIIFSIHVCLVHAFDIPENKEWVHIYVDGVDFRIRRFPHVRIGNKFVFYNTKEIGWTTEHQRVWVILILLTHFPKKKYWTTFLPYHSQYITSHMFCKAKQCNGFVGTLSGYFRTPLSYMYVQNICAA